MDEKKTFSVGIYAMSFIDILNQKEILDMMDELPETEDEEKNFVELLSKSVGPINLLRSAYSDFRTGMEKGQKQRTSELPTTKEIKDKLKQYQQTNIKSQYFSDTAIYYTPLSEKITVVPISDIYTLLMFTAYAFIGCLANGVVLRGGIDAGVGTNYFGNEVYGNVLRRSYKLESEIAEYPRIVIGGKLYRIIESEMTLEGDSSEIQIRRTQAQKSRSLITKDYDNVLILDYLGKGAKVKGYNTTELIKKCYVFIIKELEGFYNQNNYKLIQRYSKLRKYFEVSINKNWHEIVT